MKRLWEDREEKTNTEKEREKWCKTKGERQEENKPFFSAFTGICRANLSVAAAVQGINLSRQCFCVPRIHFLGVGLPNQSLSSPFQVLDWPA